MCINMPRGVGSQVCLGVVWNFPHFRFPLTSTGHSQNSARMSDKAVKDAVENFNKRSLKKTETVIKQTLPTKQGERVLDNYASSFPLSDLLLSPTPPGPQVGSRAFSHPL